MRINNDRYRKGALSRVPFDEVADVGPVLDALPDREEWAKIEARIDRLLGDDD